MLNQNEEILRLTSERLQNKVESIMLGINILLSNPESSTGNVVDAMEDKIRELAIVESSLNHAKNLLGQCELMRLQKSVGDIKKEIKNSEE